MFKEGPITVLVTENLTHKDCSSTENVELFYILKNIHFKAILKNSADIITILKEAWFIKASLVVIFEKCELLITISTIFLS